MTPFSIHVPTERKTDKPDIDTASGQMREKLILASLWKLLVRLRNILPKEMPLIAPVVLQPMKQDPPLDARCKDKFLVQSVQIPAGENPSVCILDRLRRT